MSTDTDLAGLERDWLLGRAARKSSGVRPRDYGISSDALCAFALGAPDPREIHALPNDRADLDACERAYTGAPSHLQPVMLPVLEAFREHIAAYEAGRQCRREQVLRERAERERARIAAGEPRRFLIEREIRTRVTYIIEADALEQARDIADDEDQLDRLTPHSTVVVSDSTAWVTEA